MPAYTDAGEYQRRYLALDRDSEAFYRLREEFLTPAYCIQDYGLTAVSLGLVAFLVTTSRMKSPRTKALHVCVGLLAAASVKAA